jgi:hypothetical protein
MPPVEMMAFTQDCRSVYTESRTGVKKPIQNVNSPSTDSEQECDPWFEMNLN